MSDLEAYVSLGYADACKFTAHKHEPSDGGADHAYILLSQQIKLWLREPEKARQLLAAAFEAVRILDPDGAADAVFALIEGDALAKIRARILEEDAKPPECGAVCEHDCTCSLPEGHDGDHETRGSGGQELCSWPQDAAPEAAKAARIRKLIAESSIGECLAGFVLPGGSIIRCTERPGHDGDHVAGGTDVTWPQDAAPDTAQPEDTPEPACTCTDPDCPDPVHQELLPEAHCAECYATDVPLINGVCSNSVNCAERQAAKASTR